MDTNLWLIHNVPLDINYNWSIDFDSLQQQTDYFFGKRGNDIFEYTFVKDNSVKVNMGIEYSRRFNYLSFLNNVNGKRIYAFIVDRLYINESTVEFRYEVDVYQTYQFNHAFTHSYVEREHQDRWLKNPVRPILNTVSESLDYGNFYNIANKRKEQPTVTWLLITCSEPLSTTIAESRPSQNIPTAYKYYLVPHLQSFRDYKFRISHSSGVKNLLTGLNYYIVAKNLKIVSMSWLPHLPFNLIFSTTSTANVYQISNPPGQELVVPVPSPVQTTGMYGSEHVLEIMYNATYDKTGLSIVSNQNKYTYSNIPLPSSFSTSAAKSSLYESKLLTHPYMYFLMSDCQASPLLIKNEQLPASFSIQSVVSLHAMPKLKYYIPNYAGDADGQVHNITNANVNDMPLINDVYENYLTTQKASATTGIALSLAGGAVALGVGAATGGVGLAMGAGALLTGVGVAGREMAKQKDLANTPDNARAKGNNAPFDLVDRNYGIEFYRFEIDDFYKNMLSDYWHMYGYKTMAVKVPNLRSRLRYNYIKTIQANLIDNVGGAFVSERVPYADLQKLQRIYNNGITIWHNRAGYSIGINDYSRNNVEMSLI